MLVSLGLIALGVVLLVAGGEVLLRGAVGLATLARLTPAAIGLTVVAAGTSVPELAVLGEGEARYVFVLGEGNRVRRTEVRTGAHLNGRVEIVAGLRPGQRVVTEGIIKVTDGMQARLPGERGPGGAGGQRARGGG